MFSEFFFSVKLHILRPAVLSHLQSNPSSFRKRGREGGWVSKPLRNIRQTIRAPLKENTFVRLTVREELHQNLNSICVSYIYPPKIYVAETEVSTKKGEKK